MPKTRRYEVLIAILGLIGMLATGVLSNWDKIFPREDLLVAPYTGYQPTGRFETELRYYIEVSGLRQTLDDMQEQMLEQLRRNLLVEAPADADKINAVFEAIQEEAISIDDVIPVMLDIYQKHFTVEEIQELNKFYSTETMQNMIDKLPLVNADLAPHQVRMIDEYMRRIQARIDTIILLQ